MASRFSFGRDAEERRHECARRQRMFRAAFRKLLIRRRSGNDDSPAFPECAIRHVRRASASRDSIRKFASFMPSCSSASRRIARNGRHVRVFNAVKKSEQKTRGAAGENLLEIHAACFALAARARTDDEILFASTIGLTSRSINSGQSLPSPSRNTTISQFGRQGANPRGTRTSISRRRFRHDASRRLLARVPPCDRCCRYRPR